MIDRLPCREVHPGWATRPANRYLAHPHVRTAMIQSLDDPGMVYVVTDERLPETLDEAAAIVAAWRNANGSANI